MDFIEEDSRIVISIVWVINKQRYSEALKYYELGLKGKKNKWWTKDAYHLAWCSFPQCYVEHTYCVVEGRMSRIKVNTRYGKL